MCGGRASQKTGTRPVIRRARGWVRVGGCTIALIVEGGTGQASKIQVGCKPVYSKGYKVGYNTDIKQTKEMKMKITQERLESIVHEINCITDTSKEQVSIASVVNFLGLRSDLYLALTPDSEIASRFIEEKGDGKWN